MANAVRPTIIMMAVKDCIETTGHVTSVAIRRRIRK
jgi:hypothetical protein